MDNLTEEQNTFVEKLRTLPVGRVLCLCPKCSEPDNLGNATPLLERRNLVWRTVSIRHFEALPPLRPGVPQVAKSVSSGTLLSKFTLLSAGLVDTNGDRLDRPVGVQPVRLPQQNVLHNLPVGLGLPVGLPSVVGDGSGDEGAAELSPSEDPMDEEEAAGHVPDVDGADGAVAPPSPAHLANGYVGYWAAHAKHRADNG